MKKHISVTVFACCLTFLIYAQWEVIPPPEIGPPPVWNCDSYDECAIGSNSTFYYCRNYSCGGGGSGNFTLFRLYKTEDNGQNWEFMFEGNYEYAWLNDWYFISGDTGFILRNNGGSEILERTPSGLNSFYGCYICGFAYSSIYKMIDFQNMVAVEQYNYNSIKFMQLENDTFQIIYNFPAPYFTFFTKIESTNNNFFLLGYKNGNIDDVVLKSSDGGYSWDTCFYNPIHNIVDIKFYSDSIGMIVGNNGLIYKTEDVGFTWDQKETPTYYTLKSIDYLNESTWIAVGGSGKIIMTYDGGETWFLKTSPTTLTLIEVRFPKKDGIVIVRSDNLLWKTNINNLTSMSENGQKSFIRNLFPNPAKDKVTISSSAITGDTQLSIFSVSGEKLIERQLTDTEIQIDISTLPRGVYFVRVQNEKMVEVGKVMKE